MRGFRETTGALALVAGLVSACSDSASVDSAGSGGGSNPDASAAHPDAAVDASDTNAGGSTVMGGAEAAAGGPIGSGGGASAADGSAGSDGAADASTPEAPDASRPDDGSPDAACAPTVLFSESFADNGQGWTLGPEWQIGPAKASSGQDFGFADPGSDVTGEGGVAGVDIGGNASVAVPDATHPAYFLTSPPIDTRSLNGRTVLTFYRWLSSDGLPYMGSTVECSADGVTWFVLWSIEALQVTDAAWSHETLEATACRGAESRFRWGFSIGEPGVYRVSGWNLDFVQVANVPCP